jgi:hypothetical protein
MSRPRLAVGDVFTVPVDGSRVSVGQVVGKYQHDAYYVVVYDLLAMAGDEPLAVAEAVEVAGPLLVALTFDAKVMVGDWQVIANVDVPSSVTLPAYREMVGPSGRVDVVDYSGIRRRPASSDEAAALPNRQVVAPVRVEKAVRALHGSGTWNEAYDQLKADCVPDWRDYFPESS